MKYNKYILKEPIKKVDKITLFLHDRKESVILYAIMHVYTLSLSSNSWCRLLNILCWFCCRLNSFGFGSRCSRFLGGLLRFLYFFCSPKKENIGKITGLKLAVFSIKLLLERPLASNAYLIACSLWAFLTSGFWFRFARMSWSVAPTTALWNFWVLFVRFLDTSSSIPFLCFLL